MPIPFEIPGQGQSELVGTDAVGFIRLPRYNSLTPYEILQYYASLAQHAGPDGKVSQRSMVQVEVDLAAAILLRVDPQVTPGTVARDYPMGLVAEIWRFGQQELNGWQEAEPDGGEHQGETPTPASPSPSPITTGHSVAAGPSDSGGSSLPMSPSPKSAKRTATT